MTRKQGKFFLLITLIFLFLAGVFVGAATSDKKEKKKEVISEKKTENEPVLEGVYYSDIPESPSEEVNYVKGKREGKTIMRYKDGSRVEGEYANDMKNGIWITYNPKDKKVRQESYKDGREDGKYIVWSENTGNKIAEIDYQNGKLHGKKYVWFEDGRLASEEGLINGKLHGHCISWHFNGAKHFEGDYVEGTGKSRGWYESGKLLIESEKLNGNKFGKETWWYESGQKQREQEYNEEGKNIGKFTHWDENGKVAYEAEYDQNGQRLYKREYDKDGNLIFVNDRPVDKKKTANNQLTVPRQYDLRDPDPAIYQVTEVRDQTPYPTCWAFAWMGAVEHNVLPTLPIPQYSTLHLADKNHGWVANGMQGGNAGMAMAYLTRGGGPVDETTVPYPPIGLPTGRQASYPPVKWVREIHVNKNCLYLQGGDDFVKDHVFYQRTGGVITGFFWATECYNVDNTSYYNAFYYANPNHSSIIVGWNEDYNKDLFPESNGSKPQNNGAIIMKNSWGNWGDAGYFYVSPETFTLAAKYAVVSVKEHTCKYTYQYDLLGKVDNMGFPNRQECWAANVFEAENPQNTNDILKSVGFFLMSDAASQCGINYSIYVYANLQNPDNPKSGDLVAGPISGQGDDPVNYPWYKHGGYYTRDLPTPVNIAGGSKFSVVIKYTRDPILLGVGYPCEVRYGTTLNASSKAGESYDSNDGVNWRSLGTIGNACIKAFTDGNFDHYWKLKEALDDTTLNVSSDNGYNLNWTRVTDAHAPVNNNDDAARSDWINTGERCHMEATVAGPTGISFYWAVSSDPGNSLKLYIDQDPKKPMAEWVAWKSIGGTVDNPTVNWQQEQIYLPQGSHKLEWSYEKTVTPTATSTAADCGWVDGFCKDVKFTVVTPNGGEGWLLGTTQSITWDSGGITGNLRIQLLKDDVLIGLIAEVPANPGIYLWEVGRWEGGLVTPGSGYKIRILTPGGTSLKATLQSVK